MHEAPNHFAPTVLPQSAYLSSLNRVKGPEAQSEMETPYREAGACFRIESGGCCRLHGQHPHQRGPGILTDGLQDVKFQLISGVLALAGTRVRSFRWIFPLGS